MDKSYSCRCATCRKSFQDGEDVFEVSEGVVGLRGFVAIEETKIFCTVDCMTEFFKPSRGYLPKFPKRQP